MTLQDVKKHLTLVKCARMDEFAQRELWQEGKEDEDAFNRAIAAIDMQIAIKPIKQETDEKTHYKCKCGLILRTKYTDGTVYGTVPNYCKHCGQALIRSAEE